MLSFRNISVAVCVFVLGCYGQNALAAGSGAYSVETPDAGAFGMGSAFTGEADTPAAIYYNPAGINQMSRPEVSVGDVIIAPRGQMTQPNGNIVHQQNNEYNIPNFYVVVPVISNKLTVGLGSGSYWGLGTNWGPNSPLQFAATQTNITDVDNSLVASYQVTDRWSLAASADNDFSRIDEGFNFLNPESTIGNVQVKASDDSWGYRLATMFKINDQNQIGLMYRSRINHTYTGKVSLTGIGSTYQGLFGFSPNFVSNIEYKSVIPQSVVLGYSLKPTTKWTINADVQWTDWSSMKYETLTINSATPGESSYFSNINPVSENWHSVWSETVGTQYSVTDQLRLRFGYFHIGRGVPDATYNPNIPDSNANGYTTGFGYDLTKNLSLDVAYSLLIYDSRKITNSVSAGAVSLYTGNVDGKYSEYVNIGLVSLTYKF